MNFSYFNQQVCGHLFWQPQEMNATICCFSVTQSCLTPRKLWTAAWKASLSLTVSQSLAKFMSFCISDAIQASHPLTPSSPSFQPSGTFPMSQLFASDDQNTEASTSVSVFPASIHGWFPLRLTGLILLSKGLSGVFSTTTVWRHRFFGVLPSLWSSSHMVTYGHMWPLERSQPWLYGPLSSEYNHNKSKIPSIIPSHFSLIWTGCLPYLHLVCTSCYRLITLLDWLSCLERSSWDMTFISQGRCTALSHTPSSSGATRTQNFPW